MFASTGAILTFIRVIIGVGLTTAPQLIGSFGLVAVVVVRYGRPGLLVFGVPDD